MHGLAFAQSSSPRLCYLSRPRCQRGEKIGLLLCKLAGSGVRGAGIGRFPTAWCAFCTAIPFLQQCSVRGRYTGCFLQRCFRPLPPCFGSYRYIYACTARSYLYTRRMISLIYIYVAYIQNVISHIVRFDCTLPSTVPPSPHHALYAQQRRSSACITDFSSVEYRSSFCWYYNTYSVWHICT